MLFFPLLKRIAMKQMKAIQVMARGGDLKLISIDIPEPKDNEVLIKVECCGICHGDAIARDGYSPGLNYPRIPGHEVVGFIDKIGKTVQGWSIRQRVGTGWHGGHCNHCEACHMPGISNSLTRNNINQGV
jgi:alcohol dehydrogenase, propanol-preferring